MEKSSPFRLASYILTHWLLIGAIMLSVLGYWRERQIRAEESRRFGEATRAAYAGRWFWDLEKEKEGAPSLEWDDMMFSIFGRSKDHWGADGTFFENCIDPRDKDELMNVSGRLLKSALDTQLHSGRPAKPASPVTSSPAHGLQTMEVI